jgi:SynChlorMet cassette protein ScmD
VDYGSFFGLKRAGKYDIGCLPFGDRTIIHTGRAKATTCLTMTLARRFLMATKTPVANPSIVLREEFDDWAVLFDPDTGEGYAVDPVAVFIWKRLDGKYIVEDIISELQTSCSNVPAEVKEHCMAFIEDLIKNGLAGYEV